MQYDLDLEQQKPGSMSHELGLPVVVEQQREGKGREMIFLCISLGEGEEDQEGDLDLQREGIML